MNSLIGFCLFEGDLFNSYLAAIKFMESSEEFGEDDIAKVGLLLEENAKRSRVEDTRVVSDEECDDPTMRLPQGWKWRIVGRERYIVSPEGEMFQSLGKALAQMVKFRLPEDQVQIPETC